MTESGIIVDLKPCDYGSLKAFADVTIASEFGEFTARGFRVIHERDKAPWVGFPSSSYVKNGQTVRSPLLQVGPTLRRKVIEAVLTAYEGERG